MSEGKNKIYDRLTPQRKMLVDTIIKNLESGVGLWKQGWRNAKTPVSAITGKKYNGVNRLFLTIATMQNGYTDNRWMTYNQMADKGWRFKVDEEGRSKGKNAGVAIEFYELRDRETKQPFDRHVLDGMTKSEQDEYIEENVYPIRKYYRVFNADIIEGIPEKEVGIIDDNKLNNRAENLLKYWSDNEAEIVHGGDAAYYNVTEDKIHLPDKEQFTDMSEYYSTSFHEIGHSTGHEKRLNRELKGRYGTEDYAVEELRAEIASMFIEQDLEISAGENNIENNSAYINFWRNKITENPTVLFTAIADAERITKFVMEKENLIAKESLSYAIEEEITDNDIHIFNVYIEGENGEVKRAFDFSLPTNEIATDYVNELKLAPEYVSKEFCEVSLQELESICADKEKAKQEKIARLEQVEEQPSEEYILPSEQVTKETEVISTTENSNVKGRGTESISNMADRDIVESASKTKHGEKFMALYNGENVLDSKEKDERSLMARLAMYTGDNEEQLMSIFRSSGQFNENKPIEYYTQMAKEEIKFVSGLKSNESKPLEKPKQNGSKFANAKR